MAIIFFSLHIVSFLVQNEKKNGWNDKNVLFIILNASERKSPAVAGNKKDFVKVWLAEVATPTYDFQLFRCFF